MDGGYSNLAFSPPAATATATASGGSARAARPSMELTNTKETKAWEGLAIGAVTLARTFSTGSHRFCRSGSERSSSSRRSRCRSGLPGALRRAFSMRRHPAGLGGGAGDGYWRIHDMDGGDSDRGGDDDTVEERGEDEAAAAKEEMENKKTAERPDEDAAAASNAAAAGKEEGAAECRTNKKKDIKKQRGGGILKACKKLFRL